MINVESDLTIGTSIKAAFGDEGAIDSASNTTLGGKNLCTNSKLYFEMKLKIESNEMKLNKIK